MSFFSRLKAIAGVKNGVDGNLVKTEKPFICPSDGHYGDPNDCTKFYKCAHGTPVIEYCPATLFWNQGETPSFSNSNSKHLCSYGENLELYHLVEKYDVLYYSSASLYTVENRTNNILAYLLRISWIISVSNSFSKKKHFWVSMLHFEW